MPGRQFCIPPPPPKSSACTLGAHGCHAPVTPCRRTLPLHFHSFRRCPSPGHLTRLPCVVPSLSYSPSHLTRTQSMLPPCIPPHLLSPNVYRLSSIIYLLYWSIYISCVRIARPAYVGDEDMSIGAIAGGWGPGQWRLPGFSASSAHPSYC